MKKKIYNIRGGCSSYRGFTVPYWMFLCPWAHEVDDTFHLSAYTLLVLDSSQRHDLGRFYVVQSQNFAYNRQMSHEMNK